MTRGRRSLHVIQTLLSIGLFGLSIWVIRREIAKFGIREILAHFQSAQTGFLIAASVVTVLAYALLTGYDLVAFRYIGSHLARRKIVFAAFVGYAFSNSISMAPSMAVRYRMYSYWGLRLSEISKVFFFHFLSTWLGFLTVTGFLLLTHLMNGEPFRLVSTRVREGMGSLALLVAIGYLFICRLFPGEFRIHRWTLKVPTLGVATSQVFVGTLDWALVAWVPYLLLPIHTELNYFHFLGIFLTAQAAQIISHVPGGLGVFESVLLVLLKPYAHSPQIMADLLIYRMIYTFAPLVVGTAFFMFFELANRKLKRT